MNADQPWFVCPKHIRQSVVTTQGIFFERIAHISRDKVADDLLDPLKAEQQAKVLEAFIPLAGKRTLEIGAGLAMNMIVWHRRFAADTTGIEPDAFGFDSSFSLARELAAANGLDPDRVVNGIGESLPFESNSFDVVFSTNVLEHTQDPAQVLREAVRVLRPGGILQFVYPNYHSYYDGHYGVFHPPILWRRFFPLYVKWVWRRDPAFARTLRTELNAGWTCKQIAFLRREYSFELLDLGEQLFLQRLTAPDFVAWATLGRVKRVLDRIGSQALRRMLGKAVIVMRGWTPIVLTLRKTA